MARKKVPYRDIALIKKRLAQGMSYRQSMKGTSIKSTQTIKRIAEEESNDIEHKREEFVEKVMGFGANDVNRAKLVAEMLYATKPYGRTGIEYPDWKVRLWAIQYIDKLKGIFPGKANTSPITQIENRRMFVTGKGA